MKITFTPQDELAAAVLQPPSPAMKSLPAWYKSMEKHVHGDKTAGIHPHIGSSTNTTLRACAPFQDAMGAGYIWTAPVDIEIRDNDGAWSFRWRTEGSFVTSHTEEQHPGLPAVHGGDEFVLKWKCDYSIKTPPGWSMFFTHPLNRHDLPFRTFSGIVDTDTYPHGVQFPFQLITSMIDGPIIIEKGTPLCQMFPVKREAWATEVSPYEPDRIRAEHFDFHSRIRRSYKSKFWRRKEFK